MSPVAALTAWLSPAPCWPARPPPAPTSSIRTTRSPAWSSPTWASPSGGASSTAPRGTFEYDAAARKGTVKVAVDTDSIDFGLDSMRDYAIKPDWLDVARHPVMTYTGSLVYQGDRPVALDGQLTLRGVTRPLRLTINSFSCIEHPFYKKEVCGTDAAGELNRADFGMTQFAEGEAGKVRLLIQAEAIRED